jgi:hypothetical protein
MAPLKNGPELKMERCPHCSIAVPRLYQVWRQQITGSDCRVPRDWNAYVCASCGGVVLTVASTAPGAPVQETWPKEVAIAESVPARARDYLSQAIASLHAPAGAVILAGSAVDAMLKARNYREGSLYSRIDKAAADHLITDEMAQWAHEVRLDANDQRHADEDAPLPSPDDAKRTLDFAKALADFMFVLPDQVSRGRRPQPSPDSEIKPGDRKM